MWGFAIAAFLVLVWPGASLADGVKGTFVGKGTYATEDGCKKLAAIAGGTPKNVSTVPETLTAEGFETWEGGCEFIKIEETLADKTWQATMTCMEGEEEIVEIDTFTRAAGGSFDVQVEGDGKITRFVRCDGK